MFEIRVGFDDNFRDLFRYGDLRMRLVRVEVRSVVLVALSATMLAGCITKKTESPSEKQPASATISAEGSSTVYPICQAMGIEFEKKTNHKVSVGRSGTGGGYKAFAIRQADIWNASRPIDEKEAAELKKKDIDWLELNIAVDGIVIAVSLENNWCSQLTCAQLKRIWEPDSKVEKWSDLDPAWPAEPIVLFGADTESGTFEYFTEVINGKKKATNTKYTPAADDNVLVAGIAANKYALGYIPFGYYVDATDKVKPVSVSQTKELEQTPAEFVKPTVESILGGEYAPLARPLFMYVNTSVLNSRPEVTEFLKYAVSEESQHLIEKRGFVRNSEKVRQETQAKLAAALTAKSGDAK